MCAGIIGRLSWSDGQECCNCLLQLNVFSHGKTLFLEDYIQLSEILVLQRKARNLPPTTFELVFIYSYMYDCVKSIGIIENNSHIVRLIVNGNKRIKYWCIEHNLPRPMHACRSQLGLSQNLMVCAWYLTCQLLYLPNLDVPTHISLNAVWNSLWKPYACISSLESIPCLIFFVNHCPFTEP